MFARAIGGLGGIKTADGSPVIADVPFVPYMLQEEAYHPMCQDGFSVNNHGAEEICRLAGFPGAAHLSMTYSGSFVALCVAGSGTVNSV